MQAALHSLGYNYRTREHNDTIRTAIEAATSIEGDVVQFVKSIISKEKISGKAVFVITSGINRVNEKMIRDDTGG